jgi:uncharacterized repeat protein (TIGR01451 family)
MKWNFLKKCWPFPIRKAHRPRRRKSQPAKLRARLWLEELESRTVPSTITRTSGSIFHNDLSVSPTLTSAYASYQITNTDGVDYPDVWVTIGNFTAASGQPVVTLAANAAGAIDLGPLTNGQTKTAFFYLGSNADTNVTQTHTVSVFNGTPTSGSLLTSQDFSITSVQDTIAANSNKVTSVDISPARPTIGGTFTITVTGQTGTIGAANVLDFTPAAYSSWRADAFQLIGTTITFSGGNTGTFTDTLLIPPGSITSSANTNYTAVYTFRVEGTTTTSTPVSPEAYISSGNQIKHTDPSSIVSLPPIPPTTNATTLAKSATPTVFSGAGTVTYTLTLTNSSAVEVSLDSFVDTLPSSPANVTYVAGSSTYNGAPISDPAISGQTLTWTNLFRLPANSSRSLVFHAHVPAVPGDYTNSAVAFVGSTQIDTTLNTSDNAPATATVREKATPTLNTSQQPASATVGTAIADQATVSSVFNPTGTVTFHLYNNPNGTGTPLFTDANVPLSGGMATSTGYTATATGTVYWVASYNGDSNNNPVTSDTALEPVVITPATPVIDTSPQPARATVGSAIADQATVTGGFNPTGTVTFNLYNNPSGTGTPLFTDTDMPLVNGMATSKGYIAIATGTVYWVATYHGDSNNSPLTSDTALEPVVITPATPAINTSPQPATATVGTAIADQATVTGGFNLTGTVTFNLYNNPNGTGTPLFTDANVPLVNGTATSTGYTTTAIGTVYWVASYNGDSHNNPVTSGTALEPVVITPAGPTLAINTSQQPGATAVGSAIADEAAVTGGSNPTGTVTFKLYNNPNGSGTPLFTDANVPLVNGTATSTGYTATAIGTVYWVASYNGDSHNNPVTSGTALEPVVITPATPAINTSQRPASATVGTAVADQATVTGGFDPTGTVTFHLYNNPNGTGTPLFTNTEPLSGGMATSKGYTATATGTVYWVASYNGDSNNNHVTSDTALEPVVITPATPAINTSQQPASATVGSDIADQATVTGGFNPTGTVTFNLYNNPSGTGTPLFTDPDVPLFNGTATSTGYTTTATGTDYWVATYNGDSNNHPVTSGTALEPVVISRATPAINTSQQPATVTVGSDIADQATVTGGLNPTGTVTFNLYNNPNGTGTPLFSDANVPLFNGTATSMGYTTTATGTDYWVATYNGDSNNHPVTNGTALEPVVITTLVDLSISKTVSQSQVYFGMNVTYTFTIHNLGPNTATGVVVSDPFPLGLVFVSAAAPSQGTYHPAQGIWTVGTLANGAVATLHVTFRVMTMGTIVNTAHVSAVEFDPNLSNNVASASVIGLNPAPIISKRLFLARAF